MKCIWVFLPSRRKTPSVRWSMYWFRYFDIDVFGSVRSLKLTRIDLSFNKFETLPEKVFAGLVNHQYLDLSHNHKLRHVKPKWFEDLDMLQHLYLHENAIDPKSVDEEPVFIYCSVLKVLTLYRQGENHLFDSNLSCLPAICKVWFTIHKTFQKINLNNFLKMFLIF